MLPISNRGIGMSIGFPDICLTPAAPSPLPIPYPNIGMNAQAAPFVVKVMVRMMNVINMGSKVPMTMGDEAGVAHPFFKQMACYTMGNPKVLMECLPAITFAMPTTGNMMNNTAGLVGVPSLVHVFLSLRPDAMASEDPARPVANPAGTPTECDVAALPALTRHCDMTTTPLDDGVWLVRVPRFGRDLPARMHAWLRELDTVPSTLVLDLRSNPGGELHAALELAGDFLERGTKIATLIDDDGDETVYRSRHATTYRHRLVLLVDRNTASAAELFAASLQAAGRALVLGEPSYGKRSVQSVGGMTDDKNAYLAPCATWRVGPSERVLPDIPFVGHREDDVRSALLQLT